MKEKNTVSSAVIQYVAYITMLIDHFFAAVYQPLIGWENMTPEEEMVYDIGRDIGRVAFVLFAFMLAEGYYYTRDKKKYAIRIAGMALLSEIPFDLAFYGTWFHTEDQNIFFTLLLGLLALYLLDRCKDSIWLQLASVCLAGVLAYILRADYMFMGVLLIVVLYRFRGSFLRQTIYGSITLYVGMSAVYAVQSIGEGYSIVDFAWWGMGELYGIAAFGLLYFYHGEKGRRLPKWVGYFFYPVHLLLLIGLRYLLS